MTLKEKIAKAIYEAKYPDSKWEILHPRRLMRKQRLIEAEAVLKIIKGKKK